MFNCITNRNPYSLIPVDRYPQIFLHFPKINLFASQKMRYLPQESIKLGRYQSCHDYNLNINPKSIYFNMSFFYSRYLVVLHFSSPVQMANCFISWGSWFYFYSLFPTRNTHYNVVNDISNTYTASRVNFPPLYICNAKILNLLQS